MLAASPVAAALRGAARLPRRRVAAARRSRRRRPHARRRALRAAAPHRSPSPSSVGGRRRRRRHRPGVAHDPHRPAVPAAVGGRRAAAARLPELRRRRRPARRRRPRRAARRACCPAGRPAARGRGLRRRVVRADAVHVPVRVPAGRGPARRRCPRPRGVGARLLGTSPWPVFRSVVLPQSSARSGPARCSCSSTSVSDFGAVAQLRYRTLTVEIYENRLFDRDRALVLGAAARRRRPRRRRRRAGRRPPARPRSRRSGRRRPLQRAARAVAVAGVRRRRRRCSPTRCSGRCRCSRSGRAGPHRRRPARRHRPRRPRRAGRDRRRCSASAPPCSPSPLVLPVAYLTARHRSRVGRRRQRRRRRRLRPARAAHRPVARVLDAVGPGVVGSLYQTAAAAGRSPTSCTSAPRRCGPSQVAVASVPRRLDDAARTLGAGRWRRLRSVELPLMLPGLARRRRARAAVDDEGAAGHAAAAPDRRSTPSPSRCGGPGRRRTGPRPGSPALVLVAAVGRADVVARRPPRRAVRLRRAR